MLPFLLMASSGCCCVLFRFFCDPEVTAVDSWAAIGVFDCELEITIDVDFAKGQEIKTLIENAGVSSFYLGKKGLAYVSNIRV
jgi:hypothetical protein